MQLLRVADGDGHGVFPSRRREIEVSRCWRRKCDDKVSFYFIFSFFSPSDMYNVDSECISNVNLWPLCMFEQKCRSEL